jgi:SAM-dependent methyltransferase
VEGFVIAHNRQQKARKIEAVISDFCRCDVEKFKMLDIGCGNGEIISYFSDRNYCYGVDVRNQLTEDARRKINFSIVKDTDLPFTDEFFDIVISNHVIEHVDNSGKHLKEIFRVLKKGGICYFATPNWNFPVEPHYKVPLLHYLPNSIFIGILNFLNIFQEELFLLSYSQMMALFKSNGFEFYEYTGKILKFPKQFFLETGFFEYFSLKILEFLSFLSPTNIFILKK